MAFRIGQKVVCVDDVCDQRYCFGYRGDGDLHGLKKDQVYTVRGVGQYRNYPSIFLEEITRPIHPNDVDECGYAPQRFRPVIERSTDTGMAILRKLLDGDKIKEKV